MPAAPPFLPPLPRSRNSIPLQSICFFFFLLLHFTCLLSIPQFSLPSVHATTSFLPSLPSLPILTLSFFSFLIILFMTYHFFLSPSLPSLFQSFALPHTTPSTLASSNLFLTSPPIPPLDPQGRVTEPSSSTNGVAESSADPPTRSDELQEELGAII